MALIRRVTGFDTFVDIAGTFLSDHAPTDGSGGLWHDLEDVTTNRLIIPASGRIQPNGVNALFAGAHLEPPFLPFTGGGIDLQLPRYLLAIEARNATAAQMERVMVGIYNELSNTFYGMGTLSHGANLESGDAVFVTYSPVLVQTLQGGNFARFALQNPFGNVTTILAGGAGAQNMRNQAGVSWTGILYIDEYQMCGDYVTGNLGALDETRYFAYPTELRTLRPSRDDAIDTPFYEPCVMMRSSDATATGARITRLDWEFLDFTPQEIFPDWQPVEQLFVATVELNYQTEQISFGAFGGEIRGSAGPYLVYPPSRYRDVEVTAHMIVIDNGSNPAYLDVSIGPLQYEIQPYTRFQLVLPVFSTPILVRGGGNRGRLHLYSEPISYAFG